MVDQLTPMGCPKHKIVSLVGNIASDGSASLYDVVSRVADAVKAPHYPMPLPVIATTVQDKALLLSQKPVRNVIELARQAAVNFVGVCTVGDDAALILGGRPVTQRFLHRAGNRPRIGDHLHPLVGIPVEQPGGVGEQLGERLRARRPDQ